jgi:MurNAc alpha-1-phosphate uridylyltransferase
MKRTGHCAMILAAGRGERLRPLTDRVPKPLLPAGGKPLITWHVEKLAAAGFTHVVVNHAHLGEAIETALGDGSRWGLTIDYSPEREALETAGGIRNALDLLGAPAFAVVNADVFSEFDYARLAARVDVMAGGAALSHLVLVSNPPHNPGGDFRLRDGTIVERGGSRYTCAGIGAYRRELFEPLAPGVRARLAPLLRQHIPADRILGEHYPGFWMDIGTPERLAELERRLSGCLQ